MRILPGRGTKLLLTSKEEKRSSTDEGKKKNKKFWRICMAQWGLADDLESLGAEAAKRICTPSCFLWDCIRAQWDTGPGVLGTGQEEALPVLGSPVLQAEASENWHKSRTAHNDLAYGSDPHLPAEGRTALRGEKKILRENL